MSASSSLRSVIRGLPRTPLRPAKSSRVLAVRAFSSRSQQHHKIPPTAKAGMGPGVLGALAAGALAGYYFYSSGGSEPASRDS
ncbi:hypothetical protein IWW50_004781, partial [Coemansia erecta]